MYSFTNAQGYKSVHSPISLNPGNKNEVYKIGTKFLYDYYVITEKDSGKILLKKTDSRKWRVGKSNTDQEFLVDRIKLHVVKRGLFKRTNFWETQISYEYKSNSAISLKEETGMVENKNNIWLHPPRSNFFKILEIAPFPYIKFPKENKGLQWSDEITIGNHWSDDRWASWEGNLKLFLNYKIEKKTKLPTKYGNIDVYMVHAKSESAIGISTLDMLYNKEMGIIRMTYNILDKYKIQFELTDIQ